MSNGLSPFVKQRWKVANLTRRIYQPSEDGKRVMDDFCQLAERLTANKYKESRKLIDRLIRKYSMQVAFDLSSLYELTFFCFLTGNADMHLKNFSLRRNTEQDIVLTPAYDLLATKLLTPDDQEELALSMNGKKAGSVQKTGWHSVLIWD